MITNPLVDPLFARVAVAVRVIGDGGRPRSLAQPVEARRVLNKTNTNDAPFSFRNTSDLHLLDSADAHSYRACAEESVVRS